MQNKLLHCNNVYKKMLISKRKKKTININESVVLHCLFKQICCKCFLKASTESQEHRLGEEAHSKVGTQQL